MDFLSRKAAGIVPYVPGEQPKGENLIKLNTNENPFPPSPHVLAQVSENVANLALYPQVDGETLRTAIAQREGLDPAQVFVGNGSDEVLSFCFPAFFDKDKTVRFPEITYTFYKVYAELFDIPYALSPMLEGLTVDTENLLAGDGGVVLANPNAPTSIELPLSTICAMARAQLDKGQVLIVDEAYTAFGTGQSAAHLVNQYPNLLVVRTMSKDHSLAGLRVGYALGQTHLIQGLIRIKDSFNSYPLDTLAIFGATAALQDEDYFTYTLTHVLSTRDWFAKQLAQLGFLVLPSCTNFVFVRHDTVDGKSLFDALRARSILVRRFDSPLIAQYLRITIGTRQDMEKVLAAIAQIIAPEVKP